MYRIEVACVSTLQPPLIHRQSNPVEKYNTKLREEKSNSCWYSEALPVL